MKTLLILRHAKSKHDGSLDHDRPLAKRGKRDAPRMGALIDELDLNPHLILSSDATRAHETARLAAGAFYYDENDILLDDMLYLSSVEEHLDVINNLSDEYDIVMVVGHNPTLEDLVELLTGELIRLPTATLAHIELDIESWDEADEETGELVELYRPARDDD